MEFRYDKKQRLKISWDNLIDKRFKSKNGHFYESFCENESHAHKKAYKKLLAKRGKHAAMGDFQSSGEKTWKMEDNCIFLPNMYCTQALSPRSEVKK